MIPWAISGKLLTVGPEYDITTYFMASRATARNPISAARPAAGRTRNHTIKGAPARNLGWWFSSRLCNPIAHFDVLPLTLGGFVSRDRSRVLGGPFANAQHVLLALVVDTRRI